MRNQLDRNSYLLTHLSLGAVVMALGAVEAWFGRPELFGDDISYLDVTNMIRAGDWKAAFNPVWSIGYPLLLSAVRPMFPPGIHSEMTAVFALNVLICVATWLSFLWFVNTAAHFIQATLRPGRTFDRQLSPYLTAVAACIFLVAQLGFGRVSSIGPDQLVACLFFIANGLLLRFNQRPSVATGVRLGTVLGVGFVVKAIFLSLAVILLAAALLPFRSRLPRRAALSATSALLCIMLPYAAAISWAVGRPTLGESGQLNYAYHVNQVPHWMGWQGGPPQLGTPTHPVHLLRDQPAVFAYGEPFHVTYPPQYNLHYWYDGYNHFFSPINALRAIASNLHELEKVLHENWPFTLAIVLACIFLAAANRVRHLTRSLSVVQLGRKLWLLYLPSLFGIALYLQVHLEGRYIAAFIAILSLIPFLIVEARSRAAVLLLLVVGTAADLTLQLRPTVVRVTHRVEMQRGGQWEVARYLSQSGLKPGDRVASVSTGNDIRCTWAYAAGLHIVSSIGNDIYSQPIRQRDFDLFWTDPAIQKEVLRLFREQGTVAVVVPSSATPPLSPNWQQIPQTQAWWLRLQPDLAPTASSP